VVDSAELARAAGVFSPSATAFLHFEMSLMDLARAERALIVSSLAPDMLAKYEAERPAILAPSVVETQGQAGAPAIVAGYPVFVEDRIEFRGFIMLVVKTVMFIPIYDYFDVYEVFDTPECRQPRTVIATARGSKRLDGVTTRFGGVLRKLYFDDETGKDHGFYLEVAYYTPLRQIDGKLA
jgi:hypothetical protein